MSFKTGFFLSLILICFSSCFEYIEEITYNDEQSGTCVFTVNCSQSKDRLNTVFKLDTFMGYHLPNKSDISLKFHEAYKLLGSYQGIKTLYYNLDFNNYIGEIKFSFDSTKHLNAALENLAKHFDRSGQLTTFDMFSFNKNSFERIMMPPDSSFKIHKPNKLKIFGDAKVTSIYKFQKIVKSSSNANAKISKNKKAVMLKTTVKELIKNPNTFSNTIQFQ